MEMNSCVAFIARILCILRKKDTVVTEITSRVHTFQTFMGEFYPTLAISLHSDFDHIFHILL